MQSLMAKHLDTMPRIDVEAMLRNTVAFEVERYLAARDEAMRGGFWRPYRPIGGGAFTIPNAIDASFPHQALVDSVDWDILAAAVGGKSGVSSGCAVTAQGSPNNTVAVAAGTVVVAGIEVAVSGGNVTMTAAHASLPRFDLLTVTNAGVKTWTAGTAASVPEFPAIPANSVVLAAIYVPANDNVVNSTQIVDKRVTVPSPVSAGSWTTIKKVTTETTASDTTLSDDAVLKFAVSANGEYHIRAGIMVGWAAANVGIAYGFNGPASPTQILGHHEPSNGATALSGNTPDTAYGQWASVSSTGAVTNGFIYIPAFVFHCGGTGGTLAFQWAQATSSASVTSVFMGSYLEWMRTD